MVKKQEINYDSIIGSDSEECGEVLSLVEPRQNEATAESPACGYIGITMNFPRTKAFLNASSKKQKEHYYKLWFNIMNTLGFPKDSKYCYEYCKSGQIHLHGYISIHRKCFVMGALSDLTKAYLKLLPPKHQQFRESYMYDKFSRVRCASLCLQWYEPEGEHNDKDDKSSIEYWRAYIIKQQNNI